MEKLDKEVAVLRAGCLQALAALPRLAKCAPTQKARQLALLAGPCCLRSRLAPLARLPVPPTPQPPAEQLAAHTCSGHACLAPPRICCCRISRYCPHPLDPSLLAVEPLHLCSPAPGRKGLEGIWYLNLFAILWSFLFSLIGLLHMDLTELKRGVNGTFIFLKV